MNKLNILFFSSLLLIIFLVGCQQVQLVEENETVEICQNITNQTETDYCYLRYAVSNEDESFCPKIEENGSRRNCYHKLAVWYEDTKYCEMFDKEDDRSSCYYSLAIQMPNITLCDEVTGTEYYDNKEGCQYIANANNTAPNVRNESYLQGKRIKFVYYMTDDNVTKKWQEWQDLNK